MGKLGPSLANRDTCHSALLAPLQTEVRRQTDALFDTGSFLLHIVLQIYLLKSMRLL